MQTSFRPVSLRLPLSDVAALASATARVLAGRWQQGSPLAFAFRLRLSSAHRSRESGCTKPGVVPAADHWDTAEIVSKD